MPIIGIEEGGANFFPGTGGEGRPEVAGRRRSFKDGFCLRTSQLLSLPLSAKGKPLSPGLVPEAEKGCLGKKAPVQLHSVAVAGEDFH